MSDDVKICEALFQDVCTVWQEHQVPRYPNSADQVYIQIRTLTYFCIVPWSPMGPAPGLGRHGLRLRQTKEPGRPVWPDLFSSPQNTVQHEGLLQYT